MKGISLAKEYQDNSQLQWNWATESLKKFRFNEGDKVLDVGCGDGKITALIAKQVPQGVVIGLDVSEEMVSHASSTHLDPNLQFIQGNAAAIPFKGHFDKLVSFNALHWVLEQEEALQSFKDSLKPGGSMLLVLPGKSSVNLGSLSEKLAHSEKWSSYFPNFKQKRIYYDPEEYVSLLEKFQFQVQSIEVSQSLTKIKDKAHLIACITPVVNFIGHLSPSLQKEYIDDIAKMIEDELVFPDGSIGSGNIKIEIIASIPREI